MVDGVVLLVVDADAGGLFADSFVVEGTEEVFALVDHNFVGLAGIGLILHIKLVGGELLDGEVSSADGSLMADDVGSLGHTSAENVVRVLLVGVHHKIFYNSPPNPTTHQPTLHKQIAYIHPYIKTTSIKTIKTIFHISSDKRPPLETLSTSIEMGKGVGESSLTILNGTIQPQQPP